MEALDMSSALAGARYILDAKCIHPLLSALSLHEAHTYQIWKRSTASVLAGARYTLDASSMRYLLGALSICSLWMVSFQVCLQGGRQQIAIFTMHRCRQDGCVHYADADQIW